MTLTRMTVSLTDKLLELDQGFKALLPILLRTAPPCSAGRGDRR